MQSFSVAFERKDEIVFVLDDDPALEWIGRFDSSRYERFFVFVDANVDRLWGETLDSRLCAHGKAVHKLDVAPQELSKSLAFYPTAVEFLERHTAGRFDLV